MNVAHSGARRARGERGEALGRNIHGVDAPRAAHQHRERERLAAGAGAVIGDHLAAPRRGEPREKLAAFVLHLDEPVTKKLVVIDRRLPGEAHAGRRVRRRRSLDAVVREARENLVAARARKVRAQVERRWIEEALRDAQSFVVPVLGFEPLP